MPSATSLAWCLSRPRWPLGWRGLQSRSLSCTSVLNYSRPDPHCHDPICPCGKREANSRPADQYVCRHLTRDSLRCSQEPGTCRRPEGGESGPQPGYLTASPHPDPRRGPSLSQGVSPGHGHMVWPGPPASHHSSTSTHLLTSSDPHSSGVHVALGLRRRFLSGWVQIHQRSGSLAYPWDSSADIS